MDDFGTQKASPWGQEKLFQIIKLPLHQPTAIGGDHQLE